MPKLYVRKINQKLIKRILEPRQFIQVLYGPRQVGKTTAIKQILGEINFPSHYASADQPTVRDEVTFRKCEHSGQVLPYQKMLGQLKEAGNRNIELFYWREGDKEVLIGKDGISIEKFLKSDLSEWLGGFSNDCGQAKRR